jgi:hypothetical protein
MQEKAGSEMAKAVMAIARARATMPRASPTKSASPLSNAAAR